MSSGRGSAGAAQMFIPVSVINAGDNDPSGSRAWRVHKSPIPEINPDVGISSTLGVEKQQISGFQSR